MADALQDSQEVYRDFLDAQRDQRRQIEEDLAFSNPSNPDQWEESVRLARESDPGGKRPCLVMDQTGQYVANVCGQFEKSPPSLHAIPVGGGASKEAAEQIDGRFRHIEYASRAMQHYVRAQTCAARTGVGYLIIRPEYVDRALNWQEPRITCEPDVLKVVFDPFSMDIDGADATRGYVLTAVPNKLFERRWKGKDLVDFGDTETKRDETIKSVLVAEEWYKETTTRNMLIYDMGGEEVATTEDEYAIACQAAGMQIPVNREYRDKYECVKWRRMSGADVLEESEYPAESIGIVPVYGYVGMADGRMTYCGIPRRARSPQQAYNYHISEQLAYIATAPKAPWIVPMRAIGSAEQQKMWDRAGIETRSALYWNDIGADGQPVTAPSRINPGVNVGNHEAGAAQALRDIQASIGMYQANIGAKSNETSGVAIDARKEQGEASTAHFPSHMAASLGQVGRIVMQMDARLSDEPRKQPLIGVDGTAGSVNVNPKQTEAFVRLPHGQGVSINPNVGKYGVRVVVGASYTTQRSQTNQAFAEIMRGNKEMAPTIAPFWAQTLDFAGADKFAQALAAMAPAPVKAILQPEGEKAPDPAALSQQIEQLTQALQEAIQHAKDAQEDADMAIAEAANAKRLAEVKERENDIKAYDAETKRLQVVGTGTEENAKAIVTDLINQMLQNPAPLPGEKVEEPGDGPGPDNTPGHEQGEAPAMEQSEPAEPQEPAPPSPELQALMQGQQMLTEAVGQLVEYTKKPRIKVAHRDKAGNLTHTTETIGD